MKNQSIKVLVVDDEEQIRGLFCTVLRSAGYVVRAATDGLTAIRHMEDTRFDIVVTDVCMPRMDGLELSNRICRERPGIKVLVMSGEMSGEPLVEGCALQFLRKPFLPKTLRERVILAIGPGNSGP